VSHSAHLFFSAHVSSNGRAPHAFPLQTHEESAIVALSSRLQNASHALLHARWHLHRFRDNAATRWLRAGIDVRTVQAWLGHESLATTQKYLEPWKETEKQLNEMRMPF
jgi:site-specific recombinase XerD